MAEKRKFLSEDCDSSSDVQTTQKQAKIANDDADNVEEDMDDEEDSSSVSSVEETPEIIALRQQIEVSPFHYDSHLGLIKALRDSGDLDSTRKAREEMSKIFPLTTDLWLEWITDEMPLSCITEHKQYVGDLFEKATKDYQSVKLWTEYCQYVMDNMEGEEGIGDVRSMFERAITAVGLHLTEGVSIWDGYREFEIALYDSFKQMAEGSESNENMQKKLLQQKDKVIAIFKREVSVPLIGIQGVYRDFEEWLNDNDDEPEEVVKTVQHAFKKAETKIEECLPYEEALTSAVSPKLEEYRSYIAYEIKDSDPARVQCLYERAVVENCLDANFWTEYTTYMDTKLTISEFILPVHERAVRNCPWVVTLWSNYMKAMERTGHSDEKIKELFDRALLAGFSSAQDVVNLWLSYLEYLRRKVNNYEQDSKEVQDLHDGFQNATDYLEQYHGPNADTQSSIARYKAYIEAAKLNNLPEAKKIWEHVMISHNREVQYWMEYITLMRNAGDLTACRKLYTKAIQINSDNPELLCEAFVKFEKEEGSLSDLDNAVAKCAVQSKKIWERKVKEYEKNESREKEEEEAMVKKKEQKAEKRAQKKADFKSKVASSAKRKQGSHDDVKNEPVAKQQYIEKDECTFRKNDEKSPAHAKEKNTEMEAHKTSENTHDRSKEPLTVFVSNLLFTIDEEHLKSTFSPLGDIAEVRLVRNRMGKSKGYAYVEFQNESSVAAALAIDRQELSGRPMFVSPCVDKSQIPTSFKFPTSLDKHTVFVTNLPFEMKSTDIEDVFKEHGKIKQVRLVTNRAGKSKGYAYVEYEDESSATTAILKSDKTVIKEREISVALSNPPKRSRNKEQDMEIPRAPEGSRGRSRTQVQLLPRSLQKQATNKPAMTTQTTTATTTPSNTTEEASKPGLSNADFRKMFN